MLDPVVKAALVVLVAAGIKAAAAYFGIPLDEALVNTLAAMIVTWLLSLLGMEIVRAGARKFAPALLERGLLKSK